MRDVPALAAALDEFFTHHKLPRRGVRLGVATNHVGVRTFELAGIDDERQLANAMRFRAHEALSIPVDEAVLDYRVVSESVDETGHRPPRSSSPPRTATRSTATSRPASRPASSSPAVDLEAFALLRAVAPAPARDEQAAVVAVDVGHERTTLAVSDGSVCEFTRVLEWGGAKLAAAIARELGLSTDEAGS